MNTPSHQNRFLLYVEMQLISVAWAATLSYALKRLSAPSNFPFLYVFGALSVTSAVSLGTTLAAATQKREDLILSCRIMLHVPFGIAIVYGASLVFQVHGQLALAGKCDSRHHNYVHCT